MMEVRISCADIRSATHLRVGDEDISGRVRAKREDGGTSDTDKKQGIEARKMFTSLICARHILAPKGYRSRWREI